MPIEYSVKMSANKERVHTAFWEVANALESGDLPRYLRNDLMVALKHLYAVNMELSAIEREGK